MDARLHSLVGDDDAALDERADELVAVRPSRVSRFGVRWERSIAGGSRSRHGDVMEGMSLIRGRFERLPRHRGRVVDALFYRPPGRGM